MERQVDVKVKVTKEHIAKGTPRNVDCCPISMAMDEAGYTCETHGRDIRCIMDIENLHSYYPVALPDEAIDFVSDYDRNRDVKPFKFKVTLKLM